MQMLITILFYGALAALLVVLGLGIANLARTDENQPSRSNKLMRMRIFIQAIVIALLVVIGFMAGAIHFCLSRGATPPLDRRTGRQVAPAGRLLWQRG